MIQPWIGFDLDDTLATYEKWNGVFHIGEPILPMIEILKKHLNLGYKCKIMTARVGKGNNIELATKAIHHWLEGLGLPKLEVTAEKDYGMLLLYDDRCVAVESGTGIILGGKEII